MDQSWEVTVSQTHSSNAHSKRRSAELSLTLLLRSSEIPTKSKRTVLHTPSEPCQCVITLGRGTGRGRPAGPCTKEGQAWLLHLARCPWERTVNPSDSLAQPPQVEGHP